MTQRFDMIAAELDVAPLMALIGAEPARWLDITARQTFVGSPHHATETIFIRGPRASADPLNELESVDFPADAELRDAAMRLIEALPLRIAELGRVMIVKLKSGGYIDSHTDEGAYAENFSRFHIALQADRGNAFHAGQECAHMRTGECWWFEHRVEHEVANLSYRDRIHLIFDARLSSLYRKEA